MELDTFFDLRLVLGLELEELELRGTYHMDGHALGVDLIHGVGDYQ